MEKNYPNPFWDTCLSAEERIRYLLSEMTLEEKTSFLATRQPALERLGIPAFYFGGEAAHGVEARNDQANTGTRSSNEVIQIFGKHLSDSRVRHPNKRLIGFVREKNIMLGEKRTAELTLSCKKPLTGPARQPA